MADTLVAALLLGNLDASRVVLAEFIGVGICTIALLGLVYPVVRAGSVRMAEATLRSRPQLATFIASLLIMPFALVVAI